MRRFRKKPDVTFVVIPGAGRVNEGMVLEGDEYAKFVPSLLVEIPAAPAAPVLTEPVAPKLTPKVTVPPPAPPPAPPVGLEAQVAVEPPKPRPSMPNKKLPNRK